jgi:hypothetical protein
VLYDLTAEQTPQQPEFLVSYPAAFFHIESEMLVFLRPIAKPEHISSASLADQVEDGDLFGKSNGVVERQDDNERHHQLIRACGNGTAEYQRTGQIAVRRTVVLADDRGHASPRLSPFAHVDGGLVQIGGRRTEVGSSHVETHRKHNRYLTSLSREE